MARYIKDIFSGEYRWIDDESGVVMRFGTPDHRRKGPYVIPDIEPYRSVITGEVISGRRQHRDHLRAHGCIEVGNEKPKPPQRPEMSPAGPDIKIELQRRGLMG